MGVKIMIKNKILVVVAHPDDDILGCGGTIAKLIENGSEIKIIFIAEGTSCRFSKDQINSDVVISEINKRNNYAKKALNVLGVKDHEFYNLPCGRLDQYPLIDIGKIIENEIEMFEPDAIFTHNFIDVNNDHKIVFQSVLQATRLGALNSVPSLYSFEILSSSERKFVETFKPNFFVKLNKEHISLKIKAMYEYISEVKDFPFPRSDKGIMILSNYRGMQVGVEYAEAFSLIREVE